MKISGKNISRFRLYEEIALINFEHWTNVYDEDTVDVDTVVIPGIYELKYLFIPEEKRDTAPGFNYALVGDDTYKYTPEFTIEDLYRLADEGIIEFIGGK